MLPGVTHTFNPGQRQADLSEVAASLVYRVGSKTARAAQRDDSCVWQRHGVLPFPSETLPAGESAQSVEVHTQFSGCPGPHSPVSPI